MRRAVIRALSRLSFSPATGQPAGTGPPYKTIRPGTRRSVVRAIRLRPCGTYAAAGISHSSGFRRAQPSRAAAAPSTNINRLASYLFFKRYPAFTFHKPHRAPGRPSYTPPPSALSTGKEEKPMRPDAGSQSRTTPATNDSREKVRKESKKTASYAPGGRHTTIGRQTNRSGTASGRAACAGFFSAVEALSLSASHSEPAGARYKNGTGGCFLDRKQPPAVMERDGNPGLRPAMSRF